MKNKWIKILKKYLKRELIIEYKACLYFSCILFFYFVWLALQKIYLARIVCMCEMILAAYLAGYLQMYAFHNLDESERLGGKEFAQMLLCSALYAAAAYLGSWFDRSIRAALCFLLYMLLVHFSVYLFHKLNRILDTRNLNQLLTKYKEGDSHTDEGKCD